MQVIFFFIKYNSLDTIQHNTTFILKQKLDRNGLCAGTAYNTERQKVKRDF